ncbi:hypothetical protein [Mesorhizobium sp.]|uniref:PGN_0703 family putative restriction endonuclease n=1 Tax=Mesorhizobium sp. TaxID=1871066 RepID=UPI000FE49A3A|nr:hypothetical protein [Mesorhizobium sp.]RWG13949.1 MAG: hypothetical protein EOQ58_16345 [Mesorhizobium sp.]RWG35014.1 MAG: hypothetical protein EOQ61_04155 [Mesorhizobium sp.]RWH29354.1 MAG: hypothetical protein EOQ77_03750 [Mesorhizobium sp.]TIR40982.1 MAG: hypothetical protein E5X27_03405 [Mesorhizobium sp.]
MRDLATEVRSVDLDAICSEFDRLIRAAPRRASSGKPYFTVTHEGIPSSRDATNRREEHLAIALRNLDCYWPRANGGWIKLIDYQVPLKANMHDGGVGKIDLLGVTDTGRFAIVELKIDPPEGRRNDNPLVALLEGVRYAAMLIADLAAIAAEAGERFGLKIALDRPLVQLLAPAAWWEGWLRDPSAGEWEVDFHDVVRRIESRLRIAIEFVAIEDVSLQLGLRGAAPRLERCPRLHTVSLDRRTVGAELVIRPAGTTTRTRYLGALDESLWAWAKRNAADALDGRDGKSRPPVLRPERADLNVLVPDDQHQAEIIRQTVPRSQRHRHFGSLRSSQAIAQSFFATLAAFDRLDVLAGLTAECGRQAFFEQGGGWRAELEAEIKTLGEPRPTSVDVQLSRGDKLVSVECKLTEAEFGTCSRPRLRETDPSYLAQHCDGSYHAQMERLERCPLTAIGVRYWSMLPDLFAWPADQDHDPCEFGQVYQLGRNLLASLAGPDGRVNLGRGHMLVVYDARNPAFQPGGYANAQWELAVSRCLRPGLLRRVSWQRLVSALDKAPDLTWLAEAMFEKYGIRSSVD